MEEETEGEVVSEEDLQDMFEDYNPKQNVKDSIFRFFRDILKLKDSSKTGYLKEEEIGRLPLTVRGYQSMANFFHSQKMDRIAEHFIREGEITLATSLSRKGFFLQTTVTQIKKEQKMSSTPEPQRGFLFGKPKEQEQNV